MKKRNFFILALVALFGSSLLLTSCGEEDTTGPVISFEGDDPIIVEFGSSFNAEDYPATATDDEDGDVTVTTTDDVNTNTLGDYYITYTATDKEGNSTTKRRGVSVVPHSGMFTGQWAMNDGLAYTMQVAAGSANNKVLATNFAGLNNAVGVVLEFANDGSITIPSQSVISSDPDFNCTASGSGNISNDGSTLTLTYTLDWDDGSGSDTYTATGTMI